MNSRFPPNILESRDVLSVLSRFLHPRAVSDIQDWEVRSLGMTANEFTQAAQAAGLLFPLDLKSQIEAKATLVDLRARCKSLGIRQSGSKTEVSTRLLAADPDGMAGVYGHEPLLGLSNAASAAVHDWERRRNNAHEAAQAACFASLKFGNLHASALAVAEFELFTGQSIGLWSSSSKDIGSTIERLEHIFRVKPTILGNQSEDTWSALRYAACMLALWGETDGERWLEGTIPNGRLSAEVAVRMVLFAASSTKELSDALQFTPNAVVSIDSVRDHRTCPSCKKASRMRFALSSVPEIPNPNCSCEDGCRCAYQFGTE
jgi:hypothetical protein